MTSTSLPSDEELTEYAFDVASALTSVTGGIPAGQALAELERGKQLDEEGRHNPVAFAHFMMDTYLNVAGDFAHALGYTISPQTHLTFSPAVLARSACEYANRVWWLAGPELDVPGRVARAAAVMHKSIDEQRSVLRQERIDELRRLEAKLAASAFREDGQTANAKLPDTTSLFVLVAPDAGRQEYAWLSRQAHGNLIDAMLGYQAAVDNEHDLTARAWCAMVITGRHALKAATRVHDLRGMRSSRLVEVVNKHEDYAGRFERWNATSV